MSFVNAVMNFIAVQNVTKLRAVKDSGASRCQYEQSLRCTFVSKCFV
jgi:hypothetical protein